MMKKLPTQGISDGVLPNNYQILIIVAKKSDIS